MDIWTVAAEWNGMERYENQVEFSVQVGSSKY